MEAQLASAVVAPDFLIAAQSPFGAQTADTAPANGWWKGGKSTPKKVTVYPLRWTAPRRKRSLARPPGGACAGEGGCVPCSALAAPPLFIPQPLLRASGP